MFKVMYNQLERPFALKYLLDHDDVRIIHLRRLNLLKVHVSTLLMPKRRELQANAPVEPIRIHVDPARAIESMRQAIARYELYEKIFERHPRITVAYESLFKGQELQPEVGRRICEFLGVEPQPMKSTLVKVNPESLRDIVTNYDELFAALAKTEFAATVERLPVKGEAQAQAMPPAERAASLLSDLPYCDRQVARSLTARAVAAARPAASWETSYPEAVSSGRAASCWCRAMRAPRPAGAGPRSCRSSCPWACMPQA
jgi:hypothetical protein